MAKAYTEAQLKEMPQAELLSLASELGLNVDPGEDKELLVAEIFSAQKAPAKKAQTRCPRKAATEETKEESDRVTVIFHETSGPDGDAPVKLSLNGDVMRAKRGEPVNIKRKFLKGCVDNAVMTEYIRDEEAGKVRTRNVPRFPYSFA
jgi:hypothetical protein